MKSKTSKPSINKGKALARMSAGVAAIVLVAMMTPAQAADSNPTLPINLVAPTGLPNIPALPFTGVKSAVFTLRKYAYLDVVPPRKRWIAIQSPARLTSKFMFPLLSQVMELGCCSANSVNYLGTNTRNNMWFRNCYN